MTRPLRADALRNRERLVAAATELFTGSGVDVPLDRVAKRAGVSIGTLYNHFPNRGALIDAVLPDRVGELDRLAAHACAAGDPWSVFTTFLYGLFEMQAADRAINDAILQGRPPVPTAIPAECGRGGGVVEQMLGRARDAGVLRADFGPSDLGMLVRSMAQVIAWSEGDDEVWRRHLGFVLTGVRAGRP